MLLKKWAIAAAIVSSMTLAACGGQQQATTSEQAPKAENTATAPAQGKVYRVNLNAEFAPFESLDANNNVEGFDIDLMNALAQAGNFKVEYKHQPWDSLFATLATGDADILASAVTITEERKQTMLFSDPYYEITQVVLVPNGKDVKSVDDLKKVNKVGVVLGNTGDLVAGKLLGADNPKIARFDSLPLVIKELESQGVDAVISDSAVVANYIKNNSDKGFTMVKVPDFEVEHYGFAVRKDDVATQTMLNEALKKVRESGEYDKIAAKYFAQ